MAGKKKIIFRDHKINWVCLKDKCLRNCCGKFPYKNDDHEASIFGINKRLIPLTLKDYKVIKRKEKAGLLVKENDGYWYIKTKRDGACPFLTKGLCSIYKERPLSCRAFPFFINKYCGLTVDINCPGWGRGWTSIDKIETMTKALKKVYLGQLNKKIRHLFVK